MNVGLDPTVLAAVGKAIDKAYHEFRDWVARRRAQAKALEERELNAIRAFQSVISTSNYVGKLEGGRRPDRKSEEELARLWSDAAIAFYGVNDRVTPLLHLKALSWSRPAQWIDEKVVEAGITLDAMDKLLMDLLASTKKK